MNLDNFVVRPQAAAGREVRQARGLGDAAAGGADASWRTRSPGLPSELDPEDEEAKRFDLLMLNLQLARAARPSPASSGCATR